MDIQSRGFGGPDETFGDSIAERTETPMRRKLKLETMVSGSNNPSLGFSKAFYDLVLKWVSWKQLGLDLMSL